METTVTPATKITVKDWTVLAVTRNVQIVDGALVASPVVNLTTCVKSYLGDANGAPLAALPDSLATGAAIWGNATLDLSEEVTRADGSKMTVLGLLDALAVAAAPQSVATA